MSPFIIRNISKDELKNITLEWAKEEGWNPGLNDANCFYQQDPQGFFAGELNGEIIATASAVIYGDNFAFFGCYIVKKQYRAQGYGFQLTKHRLNYVGNKRNLGLDGVIDMCDKYERIGFVTAHLNTRYQGKFPQIAIDHDTHIKTITKADFDNINVYDKQLFPGAREAFLACWLFPANGHALVSKNADGSFNGYGVIRKCYDGYKVGPLFADSPDLAEAILLMLVNETNNEYVYLDIPAPNQAALTLVNKYKMQPCFKTNRMYTKGTPDIDLTRIYGITTFELG